VGLHPHMHCLVPAGGVASDHSLGSTRDTDSWRERPFKGLYRECAGDQFLSRPEFPLAGALPIQQV
jgi:hypothetical protein